MKKLIYLFLFFIGFSGVAQNEEIFNTANELYAEGNYEEAVKAYNTILENGEVSVAVHFNLGNSYYKLNEVAPSIYHYEKALQLNPEDADVKNNLEFARNMAIDVIEEPVGEGFMQFFTSTTAILSPTGWGWAAIIFMLVFVACFLTYYFSGKALLKRIFFVFGIFFLMMAISSAVVGLMNQYIQESRSFAIVFSEEVEVKSEPNVRSAEVFTLHEGAKVKVTEDFQEWYEIELPNGNQGWMKKSELKPL